MANIFERYEFKFIIKAEQKESILKGIEDYMSLDKYGRSAICSLYFDTDDYRLIRRSIERPVYKEKLRLRSYGRAYGDSLVYAELKKKYKSVVYKRRLPIMENEAVNWLCNGKGSKERSQISAEIEYFLQYYGSLSPKVFLSYEREAYFMKAGGDFRLTFDDSILCRETELTLNSAPYGTAVLPPDRVLMEIKCSGGIPLWMTELLSRNKIYKTSFSKYGTAYKNIILPKTEAHINA